MSEWIITQIKDFGRVITGYTPSTNNKELWNGEIPFYSPADISEDVYCSDTERKITEKALSNDRIVLENSLMVTCIASIGKIALAKHRGISNQQINTIIFNHNFDPKYSYYLIKFNINELLRLAGTTAVPIVNKTEFEKISLKHYIDKTIQCRIAQILSTCDAVIEKTQSAISKYKAIKQGMLHDLFTRGIDINTRKLRPKYEDAPNLYKESKLGWVPREWEVDILGNKVESYSGGTPSRSIEDYFKGEIPWISSSELNQDEISFTKEHITPVALDNSSAKWVKKNSVLVAMYGATAGQIAYLKIDATTNQAVLACLGSESVKSVFLYYLLTYNKENILYKAQGSGQPNLSKQIIDSLLIAIPILSEQNEISKKLKTIDQKLETEQTYLRKLQGIKQGLMGDLLSGRRSVNADSAVNEPADFITNNVII